MEKERRKSRRPLVDQKFVYFQRFDEFFPSISILPVKSKFFSLFIFSVLTSFSGPSTRYIQILLHMQQ